MPNSTDRNLAVSAPKRSVPATTPWLLVVRKPKLDKRRFPHDTQVQVLADFSSCAYFWFRIDEREHAAKQCKESESGILDECISDSHA